MIFFSLQRIRILLPELCPSFRLELPPSDVRASREGADLSKRFRSGKQCRTSKGIVDKSDRHPVYSI